MKKVKGLGLAPIKQEGTSFDTLTGERVMYRLYSWSDNIEIVRVGKVTGQTVTLLLKDYSGSTFNRKAYKHDGKFFDTWGEAKAHLLQRTRDEIDFHIEAAKAAKTNLRIIKKMREPK